MKEDKKMIKTTPLLLEVVEQGEGKITFIVRNPQSAQIVCLAESVDELAQFLYSFTS